MMIKGGIGGGNTQTGLNFEGRADLLTRIASVPGYRVNGNTISHLGQPVAETFKKNGLYTHLREHGVNYKDYISKKLLPDDAILVHERKTLYIVEMKFQQVAGSVDEKLQTCDFKRKQYKKLLAPLDYDVEYIYVLNDWFKKSEYTDVLSYIQSVNCRYYFEFLPYEAIGLEAPGQI